MFLKLPVLKEIVLRLEYTAIERVQLPQEEVSVWRGLIGRYVRRISPQLNAFFFETPREILRPLDFLSPALRGSLGLQGSHVPHPFVLRSPSHAIEQIQHRLQPGEAYRLELVLIEKAAKYLPLLYAMFEDIGLSGVGQKTQQRHGRFARGRMVLDRATLRVDNRVQKVYDGGVWMLPEESDFQFPANTPKVPVARSSENGSRKTALDLCLKSPLRLYRRGRLVDAKSLSARDLTEAMVRRYYALACCYAPDPPSESDIREARTDWIERANQSSLICNEARWNARRRYSGRQQSTVSTGGVVGHMRLESHPDLIASWERFLQIIESLHIGKGTSFGQGWIALMPVTDVNTYENNLQLVGHRRRSGSRASEIAE